MDELQEMREQLAALKEKLNKQEVVNDRLIRDTIVSRVKELRKGNWCVVGVVILLLVLQATLMVMWKRFDILSVERLIFSAAIVGGLIVTMIINRKLIHLDKIYSGNLKDVIGYIIRSRHKLNMARLGYVGGICAFAILEGITQYVQTENTVHIFCTIGFWVLIFIISVVIVKLFDKKEIKMWMDYLHKYEDMSELDEEKEKTER